MWLVFLGRCFFALTVLPKCLYGTSNLKLSLNDVACTVRHVWIEGCSFRHADALLGLTGYSGCCTVRVRYILLILLVRMPYFGVDFPFSVYLYVSDFLHATKVRIVSTRQHMTFSRILYYPPCTVRYSANCIIYTVGCKIIDKP